MNGFERSKHQLNVGGVPQHRVEDLGKDLMGLFGSVEQGVNTYVKIGEQTASIDAKDKILRATKDITSLREQLVKYEEANDTQGILNVKEGINRIVTEVKSYGDENSGEYAANIPARNKYNAIVNEWGASTLSTWMPSLEKSFINAAKNKLVLEAQDFSNLATEANIAIGTETIKSSVETAKGYGLNEDTQRKVAETFIEANLQNATGAFYADANRFIKDMALIKDGKFDRTARRNVLDTFLPYVTLAEDGSVIPSSDGMLVTQNDVLKVEKFLNLIESSFSKDGEAYNADFRLAIDKTNELISAYLNGDSGVSFDTNKNKYINTIENYDVSMLSTSEIHMRLMTIEKMKDLKYKTEIVNQDINSNLGNPNALYQLTINGRNDIPAPIYKAALQNKIEKNDEYVDTLIANDEFTKASGVALNTMMIAKRIDVNSSVYKKYTDIMEGTVAPVNTNELKFSLELMYAMSNANMGVKVGTDPESEITKGSVALITSSVASAEREAKKVFPDNPQKQFQYVLSAFNNSKKHHRDDFKIKFETNKAYIRRNGAGIENLLNNILNLGSSEFDELGYSAYFSNMAAKQNTLLNEDNIEEFLQNNTTRLSSWMPMVKATIVPKLIASNGKEVSQDSWEAIIDSSFKELTKKNATLDKDEVEPIIRMVDDKVSIGFVYKDGSNTLYMPTLLSADDVASVVIAPKQIREKEETQLSNEKLIKTTQELENRFERSIASPSYKEAKKRLEKNNKHLDKR